MTRRIAPSLQIHELNTEGLSRSKILPRILGENKIEVATIQGTHVNESDLKRRGRLPDWKFLV